MRQTERVAHVGKNRNVLVEKFAGKDHLGDLGVADGATCKWMLMACNKSFARHWRVPLSQCCCRLRVLYIQQDNAMNFHSLNAQLNPICHLPALLGAHHILHVSRIRVNTRH